MKTLYLKCILILVAFFVVTTSTYPQKPFEKNKLERLNLKAIESLRISTRAKVDNETLPMEKKLTPNE